VTRIDAKRNQFPSGFLVAVLLLASGLLWAVMFFGPLAHLTRLASGLTPFDIRLRGYSYTEAHAFLEAIGAQGRACYASPELILDTFYPPLYAVSRGLALWWLTMPGRVREAPLPLKVRYALVAVPILMASLDLLENGCIGVMLWTWPDLSHGLIKVSSLATQLKIIAGVLTEALMGALAVVWLMRCDAVRHKTPRVTGGTATPRAVIARTANVRSSPKSRHHLSAAC
jgi:hypothetical protein